MEKNIITQYFEEVETIREYNGYFCSIAEAITIVIFGSICGLRNICLLKLVKPESLNRCFIRWVESILPEKTEGLISLDGKTVHSTRHMDSYESPLHIVSAQISELGMAFAQKSVEGKSNEIPAVQELIKELEVSGCMVVADALNCQKKQPVPL